jgi:hypothetical protein
MSSACASSATATGGGSHADTQAAGVVFAVLGADGRPHLLPGVRSSVVSGLSLSTVPPEREVGTMPKYKRWERPEPVNEQKRTVRHSRVRFWPVRRVACEECGDQLPPSHPFGVYGSWCVLCWGWFQGASSAVGGSGPGALVSSRQVVEVWVDG